MSTRSDTAAVPSDEGMPLSASHSSGESVGSAGRCDGETLPKDAGTSDLAWAEQPCDRYPIYKQGRCERLWREINSESVARIAQFGTDQSKRWQEGTIIQEQHLQENTAFIKLSAEKRLRLLSLRKGKA